MIPRYTPAAIAAIFSDESRLGRWLEVELLAAEGWAASGRVPAEAAEKLRAGARVDPVRIAELEAEQGHDVAAFVQAVQETVGDEGRYFHLGLTSSDVVDTALAAQLRDAARQIDEDAAALERALAAQAVRHRLTLMPGRTHGVHAEPLSLGVKLANHYDEVRRGRARLAAAAAEVAVGRVSGPVGTHTSVPPGVEEHVCQGLGLGVAAAATQVLARDRHAAFVAATAILGASLERLATTVRLLQQTEVAELEEPFAQRQKGSSAMPHKHNPVLSERVCGMARVLRGYAVTAMEDVALWHERDISHSSAERIVLPDSCALLDYMLRLCTRLVTQVRVNPGKMLADVETLGRITCSPRVLDALIVVRLVPGAAPTARSRRWPSGPARGEAGFETLVEAELGAALSDGDARTCFDLAGLPRRHRSTPTGGSGSRSAMRSTGRSRRGATAARHRGGDRRRARMTPVLMAAQDVGLEVFRRGKVRDTFVLDDGSLLMVATDRLSAFDVVLPDPIPEKGRMLTQISRWWFDRTARHRAQSPAPGPRRRVPAGVWAEWRERSMRCARAERIDIECVVRGHLSGSGWKEYREQGTLAGEPLPPGLRGVLAAPRAALHPGDQERQRARREHQPCRAGRDGRRRPRGAPRADLARALPLRRRALHRAGHHPRRHQVRVRA